MNKVFFGDCRETMKRLIAEGVKVQTCVTSPPYWGLRDYGHEGQIGLEKTPEEYTARIVEVFGLVWNLLADDGTLWLNLGDSYAANGHEGGTSGNLNITSRDGGMPRRGVKVCPSLKPKDLVGIPWRVAFALQKAGWYLRSDIIWHKPNPMPESVADRPTKAHEYIFLLSKRERYYYDAEAILEPVSPNTHMRLSQNLAAQVGSHRANGGGKTNGPMKAVSRKAKLGTQGVVKSNPSFDASVCMPVEKRNKRSVWTVATMPFSGAHFATFPPALIEPCILAGSRPGDIVFDPFIGSGTTGQVAEKLGRQWIGCEIQGEYEPLQKQRTAQTGMIL